MTELPERALQARYTLHEKLGSGGQGEVWRASDPQRGGDVALKILRVAPARTAAVWSALVHEHAIASRLEHPGILKVFAPEHLGEDTLLLPMELAPGGDLRRMRGSGYLRVVPVLIEIAKALEHAHQRDVIHRDLKPGNVLFDAHGAVKIADFGAAGTALERVDPANRRLSPFSASPQQLRGEAPTPADDIYGLGALAYELLSSYPPYFPHFDARRAQIEPVPELKPAEQMPPLLGLLIARMLAKDAASRPGSMGDVIGELEATLNDTLSFDFEMAEPAREADPVDWSLPPREPPPVLPPAMSAVPPAHAAPALQLGPEVVDSRLVMQDLKLETVPPLLRLEPMRSGRRRALLFAGVLAAVLLALWYLLPLQGAPVLPVAASAGESPTAAAAMGGPPPVSGPAAVSGPPAASRPAAPATAVPGMTNPPRADARAPAVPAAPPVRQIDRPERHFAPAALTVQLTAGREAFDAGELEQAARAFEQAQRIDPRSQEAQRGLAQANAALADDDYAAAAGEGFDALAAGRLEAARAAFERARALRPEGVAAAEGLRRVDQAVQAGGGGSP